MKYLMVSFFAGLFLLACTQKESVFEGTWQDSQGNQIQITHSSFFTYRIVALPNRHADRQQVHLPQDYSENEIISHFMNSCTAWLALSGQVLKCQKGWFSNAVSMVYLPNEEVLQVQIEQVPVINSYHRIRESAT